MRTLSGPTTIEDAAESDIDDDDDDDKDKVYQKICNRRTIFCQQTITSNSKLVYFIKLLIQFSSVVLVIVWYIKNDMLDNHEL